MKKNVLTKLCLLSLLLVVIVACTQIPTIPGVVPPDPFEVMKPSSWGNTVRIYGAVDKEPFLTPLAIPDVVKIRLNIPSYAKEELSEDNFLVFEDDKAQGFLLFKESSVRSFDKVDIGLIVDVTASMGDEIAGVKSSISNFINDLTSMGIDVRVGIMPYGDYAPASPTTDDETGFDPPFLDLSDLTAAASYANQLALGYGRYDPENAYGAIMKAWEEMSWRDDARKIFILITDAVSHYRGDGVDESFEPQYTKEEVIDALSTHATLHIVASVGWYYSESDTDFSNPNDPREIAIQTGGYVIYFNPGETFDLTALGITEAITSSWIVAFGSDSPAATHTIEIFFEASDENQGYLKLAGIKY